MQFEPMSGSWDEPTGSVRKVRFLILRLKQGRPTSHTFLSFYVIDSARLWLDTCVNV